MFRLLRSFTIASALAVLAVAMVTILLVRKSDETFVVRSAERENVTIALTLLNGSHASVSSYLAYARTHPVATLPASPAYRRIDQDIREMIKGLAVVKMRLYLTDGTSVYSTQAGDVGTTKADATWFRRVVATDKPLSKLTASDGADKPSHPLAESAVPIPGPGKTVLGVLQIYTDVTDVTAQIRRQSARIVFIGSAVAGGLWLFLLLIVARGDRILRTQYAALAGEIEERRIAQEELRQIAGTDALTGTPNRRQFTELAGQEMRHSHRYGHAMSALMIDLDKFKEINDTFGHAAGDKVLIEVAAAIRRSLRATDIMGRLGGDEFAAVLVEADIATAEAVARRVRNTIAGLSVVYEEHIITPQTSIGGAHLRPGESLEALLARADDALYEAKEAGRNTVMFDQGQAADRLVL